MGSNFFTNQGENTRYKKFVGVFEHMQNIEYFKIESICDRNTNGKL